MATYPTGKPTLDTYAAIVSTFSDFLTVAIHTILYERNIYPPTSFLSARKYNYPMPSPPSRLRCSSAPSPAPR
ncbi:DNA-binding HORMA [Lasallia pustulata]|uniref:DNA-binding HORMA n=1 Tax=Lasallia pustulata TaxID=136370 RepID=A0A1W5DBI9_9LECA|nr:DNA-binding HORMA [Lasallia pustulata]